MYDLAFLLTKINQSEYINCCCLSIEYQYNPWKVSGTIQKNDNHVVGYDTRLHTINYTFANLVRYT